MFMCFYTYFKRYQKEVCLSLLQNIEMIFIS